MRSLFVFLFGLHLCRPFSLSRSRQTRTLLFSSPRKTSADFYDADTLAGILDLHSSLNLGEVVAEEVQQDGLFEIVEKMSQNTNNRVRAIACDVDGTLIPRGSRVADSKSLKVVRRAIKSKRLTFFLATGKTRKGAIDSLVRSGEITEEELLGCPGVYLQGLVVVNSSGEVIYERRLNLASVAAAVEKTRTDGPGLAVVGYDGETILCDEMDLHHPGVTQLNEKYGEPRVMCCDGGLSNYASSFHKLLVIAPEDEAGIAAVDALRPKLEVRRSERGEAA